MPSVILQIVLNEWTRFSSTSEKRSCLIMVKRPCLICIEYYSLVNNDTWSGGDETGTKRTHAVFTFVTSHLSDALNKRTTLLFPSLKEAVPLGDLFEQFNDISTGRNILKSRRRGGWRFRDLSLTLLSLLLAVPLS